MSQLPPPIPDPRQRAYHAPVRVVWQQGAEEAAALARHPVPVQIATNAPPRLQLAPGAAVLLDFGRELHGGVRLVVLGTPGNKPAKVRVRFGESVGEAMADPFPIHGHAVHDHEVSVPWCGSAEVGQTGFRFVRIDARADGPIGLVAVSAVTLMDPAPRIGSFRCSDPVLERIWQVGADTVHLCMQELLWDGIKRDRLVWIGDMHPETRVISCVFGAHPIVPASLDHVRDHTPLPGWMNGISSYSLWWLVIQRDWYRHHGDQAYLERQVAYADGLVRQVTARIGADGREDLDGWRFLDWPTSPRPEVVHAGLQGLAAIALEAGIDVLAAGGHGESATTREARSALARLRTHHPDPQGAKQAAALQVLAGLADPVATNAALFQPEPTVGMSTFYGSYVLDARARAGDIPGALALIRTYWGAMLERGATSFWEDLDLAWLPGAGRIDELTPPGMKDLHGDFGAYCYQGFRHSLCHGWAAGPTAWLSEQVLGLTPLAPGCRRLGLAPQLGDLAWAEGSYPTPFGPVVVRHERQGERIASSVSAPREVEIVRADRRVP